MTTPRAWLCAMALLAPLSVLAGEGTLQTGSRTPYVHRVSLYDTEGEVISPEDEPLLVYSPSTTCGKCHSHDAIRSGWHFNAADPKVDAGRPGEPWILTDLKTGTQIPVSSRKWPGTYRLADVGLTPWRFVLTFGRQMPGGGLGDRFAEGVKDPKARWKISGKLEIGCLACHSDDPRHDQTEWGKQIAQQNFKWAPLAAQGLAIVRGSAKKLPDTFDPLIDADPAAGAGGKGPKVHYDTARFDADERVLFKIAWKPSADRCYFCHSSKKAGEERAVSDDPDVHLAAGLTCADCHRNGLDHAITRGTESHDLGDGKKTISTLSCLGCHLIGRLGAPTPKHLGLPATHLEKLTCTACHSGPWPGGKPFSVRTSRAHGLGIASMHRRDDVPPFIVGPVFLPQPDGKIAPHRMMWPAFWARLKGDGLAVISPDAVAKAAGDVLGPKKLKEEDWKQLTEEQIGKTLEALSGNRGEGEPVYICGGKLFRRGGDGKVVGARHATAKPYAWPLAHDVRPAGQSLGSGGCTDCHDEKSGFFFAQVAPMSPAQIAGAASKAMYELQGRKLEDVQAWEFSARYRNVWIWIGVIAAAVLGLVFGNAIVMGLAAILRGIFVRKPRRVG